MGNDFYSPSMNAVSYDNDLLGSSVEQGVQTNYSGKPIAIEFYEARLSNVLRVFTDQTGVNFIYPQQVAEVTVTVKLTDVPWDAALRGILEANGLSMARVTDEIVRIDFVERIRESLEQKRAAKREKSLDMETKVMVFRLSYARGTDLAETVTQMLTDTSGDVPVPNVRPDDRTNSLIVEGIPPVLNKAKAIIERLDTPTLQAEIAIRVVEVSKGAANFLGINWGGALNFDGGRGLGFGSVLFPNSMTSNFAIDAGGTTADMPGQFNFRFGSLNSIFDLDLRLRLEEQKNTTEILQSTKVIVQDGQTAEIGSGSVDYLRRAVAFNVGGDTQDAPSGLDEINYELSLDLKEVRISRDGMVTVGLNLNSETPKQGGGISEDATAGSNRRRVTTTLVKRSGETAVIGGIYNVSRFSDRTGVPFLSSLPLIGPLFRSSVKRDSQSEMLLMLTPKILGEDANFAGGSQQIGPTAVPADSGFDFGFNDAQNFGFVEQGSNFSNFSMANNGGQNWDNNWGTNDTSWGDDNWGDDNWGDDNWGDDNWGDDNWGDDNWN